MKLSIQKPDIIGAVSSSLCAIHCLVTPILFAAQSYALNDHHHHHHESPIWWSNLDFLFLVISVFAIYRSSKNSSNKYIKIGLWSSWLILFLLILNEKNELLHLPEILTYIAAFTLAFLHIYNLNYCQCNDEDCCSSLE